jgi:hypothetical protein
MVCLRNGKSPQTPTNGYAKGPQWSYPSMSETDGQINVTSVTYEVCRLSVIPVKAVAIN